MSRGARKEKDTPANQGAALLQALRDKDDR